MSRRDASMSDAASSSVSRLTNLTSTPSASPTPAIRERSPRSGTKATTTPRPTSRWRARSRDALALAGFTVISLTFWWKLIAAGLAHQIPGTGWADNGQAVWAFAWLPFALRHGLDPLLSTYQFAPRGVNLLANTAFVFPALVFSPLTVAVGPVASSNLAIIAAPVISAGVLYLVLRHYSLPGFPAFLGGVLFGFSPYLLHEDIFGHYNLTWMFFPPLVFLLLDRILVRQDGHVLRDAAGLCGLTVVQFFTSTEVLVTSSIMALVGIAVLVVVARGEVRSHLGYGLQVLGLAVTATAVLLGYPLLFALLGPEHLNAVLQAGYVRGAVTGLVWPSATSASAVPFLRHVGSTFLGPVAVILGLYVCARRRREPRVLIVGVLALASYLLGLGPHIVLYHQRTRIDGPFLFLEGLPLLREIVPYRFAAYTDLALSALAVIGIADLTEAAAARRAGLASMVARGVVACGLGVGLVLFPLLGSTWPYPSEAVPPPNPVLESALVRPGSTVLVYPLPGAFFPEPLIWQAESGMRYKTLGGYFYVPTGPHSVAFQLATRPLARVLLAAALHRLALPLRRDEVRGIAADLSRHDVALVIVVPGYPGDRAVEASLTEVLGRPPLRRDGASFWKVGRG